MALGAQVDVIRCLMPGRIYRMNWRFGAYEAARTYSKRWVNRNG